DANLPSDYGQFGLRTRGQVDTADHDAAAIGPLETDDASQQRRLAGSAPAEQRHDFATVDVETDAIEHAPAAVGDRHVADRNQGFTRGSHGVRRHPAALQPRM